MWPKTQNPADSYTMVWWSKYYQHPHSYNLSQHSPWQLWHLWNSGSLYVHAWSAKPLKVTLFVLVTVCMISHCSAHLTTNRCPVDTTPIPAWNVHILGAWRVLLWTTLPQHLLLPQNPICCQWQWGYTQTIGSLEGMYSRTSLSGHSEKRTHSLERTKL